MTADLDSLPPRTRSLNMRAVSGSGRNVVVLLMCYKCKTSRHISSRQQVVSWFLMASITSGIVRMPRRDRPKVLAIQASGWECGHDQLGKREERSYSDLLSHSCSAKRFYVRAWGECRCLL
jgi:hypothetical protein